MRLAVSVLLGISSALCFADALMDNAFEETVLKSLSPALRAKLEEIHNDESLKTKSDDQLAKILESRLTPEEAKELEAAFRELILPMIQSTLEKQLGQKISLDQMPPVEFEKKEMVEVESEEAIDEDFLDSSERMANPDKAVNEEL